LDLYLRLGVATHPYQLSDRVILVNHQGHRFGIIVNDVSAVESIADAQINAALVEEFPHLDFHAYKIQRGIAHLEDRILVIVDPELILHPREIQHDETLRDIVQGTPEGQHKVRQALDEVEHLPTHRQFCPHVTPEERAEFQRRAEALRQGAIAQTTDNQTALAIVQLSDELFGLELTHIREFTEVTRMTPIPWCPGHIVGNTNLRGEVITLVDMSSFLGLPPLDRAQCRSAVIVEADNVVVGILVGAVVDVHHLPAHQISLTPTAIQGARREILRGETAYHDKMVSLLAIEKLLTLDSFQVNASPG
jgi:purine-binding chemotaxis protein CheW